MSAPDTAPIVATTSGAVVADLSDVGEIAPPPQSISGTLWIMLVVVLGIVVVSADVALIYGFVVGRVTSETVLLVFTTTIAYLMGLYTQRPGTR